MINDSGIGTYLKNILPGLVSSNEFTITCLGYKELKDFEWFSKVNSILLSSTIFSISEQLELFFKIPKCDVFWSPNWNIPFLPIKAKKRIVTIHDVYYLSNSASFPIHRNIVVKIYMLFIKWYYEKIITVSNFSKCEIVKYTKIPSKIIEVSYLAVEDNFVKFEMIDTYSEEYILFVGNVKPHKNLKLSLEAFNLIEDKNLKFYIVGKIDGFNTGDKELVGMINELDSRIVFTGKISDSELKNYYKHAKLFLFPSTYEGFGLPILEAMKFNLPIIASTSASIPEVAGNSVIYFDSSSVMDLKLKLDMFLKGEISCNILEYKKHLEKFSWESTIKKHIDIFNSL